ncbi:MAG: DUF4157 domain-containing protein [Fibrobacter sp.]|nr:DUF4157 domain-containing protein [Fibrobacter sp.]
MSTTYTQHQSPAQKKDAPTASSVLDNSPQSESLQRKADMTNNATQRAEVPRPNNTGMPDNLKAGIESLSGFSMDDVRVHYNSSKPATVQALAYTQGTDIHVAPGQEKHLPHEAWHVAQQMAGRVSPTTNINGMPVNDNAALEHEADVMGEKAMQQRNVSTPHHYNTSLNSSIQCITEEQKMRSAYITYVRYCSVNNYTPMSDDEFYVEFSKPGRIDSKLSPEESSSGRKNQKSDEIFNISWTEMEGNVMGWKKVISGTWVRALSINHFSYQEFYENHILSSEGCYDMPAWTMGDGEQKATKWLPGVLGEHLLSLVLTGLNFKGYEYWKNRVKRSTDNPIIGIGVKKTLSEDFIGCYKGSGGPTSEVCVKGPLTIDEIDGIYLVHYDCTYEDIGKDTNRLPKPIKKPTNPFSALLLRLF